MPLESMTGFARSDGSLPNCSWYWELRSVNGRGADIRLRLPPGYDNLEAQVRERVAKRIGRGNVAIALVLSREISGLEIRLNERALHQVLAAAERVRNLTGAEAPRVEGLLAIKGVLEIGESQDVAIDTSEETAALLSSFATALDHLCEARRGEGQRLEVVILGLLDGMAHHIESIVALPSRTPEAIQTKLAETVAKLLGTSPDFDPVRLHQEAVLLAVRADVAEELARLASHLTAACAHILDTGSQGRKLDFLAQEFSREVNTLCAKSNDIAMTRAGLALKALVDQFREQIQNVA